VHPSLQAYDYPDNYELHQHRWSSVVVECHKKCIATASSTVLIPGPHLNPIGPCATCRRSLYASVCKCVFLCQTPSKRRTDGQTPRIWFAASVRPSVCFWHGRRVAATSTRRDGGDRGGRCCHACSFVRPSLRWSLTRSSVVIKLRTWSPFHILITLLIPDLQTIETYYSGVIHLQHNK